MPGYPAQYESEAALSDGSRIHLRAIPPDDGTRLLDLYHRLSPQSLYHRFFTIPRPAPVYAGYLADVDYINQFALVGVCDARIIGIALTFAGGISRPHGSGYQRSARKIMRNRTGDHR